MDMLASPKRSEGDQKAFEIAFSIAVSCQPPPKAKPTPVLNRDRRCESAPDLDLLCGPAPPLKRSPKASRRKIPRRRGSVDSGKSLLNLSELDFSLSEANAEEMDDVDQSPKPKDLRIGLNERDVSSKGIDNISRALTLVRLGDSSQPLVELQLAYNGCTLPAPT